MGYWAVVEGSWAAKRWVFIVTWLIVGASNDLQMTRNLTGGLPVVYQGLLTRLGPFRECLTPAHNERRKGNARWHRSAGVQNGQRGKCLDASDEHVCKCDAHDDMI